MDRKQILAYIKELKAWNQDETGYRRYNALALMTIALKLDEILEKLSEVGRGR